MRGLSQLFVVTGFVTVSALAGCAPPVADPQTLAGLTELQLCDDYTRAKSVGWNDYAAADLAELDRRGRLTSANKRDMADRVIRTGMPDWLGVCVWGPVDTINRSGGVYGSFDQYVLQSGSYFYTRSGRVESWQQ